MKKDFKMLSAKRELLFHGLSVLKDCKININIDIQF